MHNRAINWQTSNVQRALKHFQEVGVEVRRINIASDQAQAVIVCTQRTPADSGWWWCEYCRLVWLNEDVARAGRERAEHDESRAMDARLGPACDMRACLHCGCSDLGARRHADGSPCFWIQPGLCSVCAESFGVDVEAHRAFGAEADTQHAIAGVARGELVR